MQVRWTPYDFDTPFNVPIRARYKDGTENVGEFFQHDLGNEWVDKQDPGRDDWPSEWAPLEIDP